MSDNKKNISRRVFFKTAGAAGIGTIAASIGNITCTSDKSDSDIPESDIVPTRPFGKTGVNVSILSLGAVQDLMSKQVLLRQAIKMGVTYWDTASFYYNHEEAIGNYFIKFPKDRKEVFLVTKTPFFDPNEMNKKLERSLERLKTSYIDLFFIHDMSNVKYTLDKQTRTWVEKVKSSGKIRLFGFSTHSNMEACLTESARLGWVDGIMTSYNYRLMHTDGMKRAVDACAKAGIGLTAMKTQASLITSSRSGADIGIESKTSKKLTEHFMNKGFTLEQAKLKAVWENPNIASICSLMPNMTILKANVVAALDKTSLSVSEKKMFNEYARETANAYCAGCSGICESSIDCDIPVSDVFRYLMYYHGYEDRDRAKRLFKEIPIKVRRQLANTDYSIAERKCPMKIPIAKYMKEAAEILA